MRDQAQPSVLVHGGTLVTESGVYPADVVIDQTGVIETVAGWDVRQVPMRRLTLEACLSFLAQ